jgi:hypothetical protein
MGCIGMTPSSTADKGPWNSLEIAKFAASVIAPFILAFCGYLIWDAQRAIVERREIVLREEQKAADARTKAEETLRQLRVTVYINAAPLIREVLTYHFHVGSWKELSPAEVIKMKRTLDRFVYGQDAVLSPAFASLYHNFMREAFAAAGNSQGESRIRSSAACRPRSPDQVGSEWERWFTGEDNRLALCNAYRQLRKNWATELSLPPSADSSTRECPPFYGLNPCT